MLRSLVFLVAAAAAGAAQSAIVLLDFEGVGNLAAVNDFYNGGPTARAIPASTTASASRPRS